MSLIRFAVFYVTIENFVVAKLATLAGFDRSLYTWGGLHFGRRVKNMLLTCGGVEAGRFYGDEIFSAEGIYLGELKERRLITHMAKRSKREIGYQALRRKHCIEQTEQPPRPMYTGYEDFPHPGIFHKSISPSVF